MITLSTKLPISHEWRGNMLLITLGGKLWQWYYFDEMELPVYRKQLRNTAKECWN